ncbi:hypothetical protein GF373_16485 [bacterium]|nr:hypothetical protein [bacterium]
MIHPSLLFLLKLRFYAGLRQMKRNVKSPKKAVVYVAIVAWFCLAFGPSLLTGMNSKPTDPQVVRLWIAGIMFLLFVMQFLFSVGDKAVNFKPSEIDFLFTGPFSRRQLVLYKIVFSYATSFFPLLIFSFVLFPHAPWFLALVIGVFFGQNLIQLAAILFALIRQSLPLQMYSKTRRYLLLGIVVVGLVGIKQVLPLELRVPTFAELQQAMQASVLKYILFPFDVFGRIIVAGTWVELLTWAPIGILLNGILIGLILQMDRDFVELSWQASHRFSERLKKAQSSGAMISSKLKGEVKTRLPMFPRLAGVGPLLWRQILQFMRSSKSVAIIHFVVPLFVGPVFFFFGAEKETAFILIGILAYVTFLFSFHLRWDFRIDLDQIAWFKRLPMSALGIVVSEISMPVFLLTSTQLLALMSYAVCVRHNLGILGIAALFTFPINTMLASIQNFVFLLFPIRVEANTAGDMSNFGKGLALFFFMSILILLCGGLSAGLGLLAYFLFFDSVVAFIAVSWISLSGMSMLLIPCVLWAYLRFDVSDLPADM